MAQHYEYKMCYCSKYYRHMSLFQEESQSVQGSRSHLLTGSCNLLQGPLRHVGGGLYLRIQSERTVSLP